MRVLFLDIDGVLNSHRSFVATHDNVEALEFSNDSGWVARSMLLNKTQIDPICVSLINSLCNELDLHIVLSSSHRNLVVDSEQSTATNTDRVREYLRLLGITTSVVGYTPFCNTQNSTYGISRGLEIREWVTLNHVTQYVIVDDYDQFLPHQKPFFSITDQRYGFDISNMEEIKAMFGIKWSPDIFL